LTYCTDALGWGDGNIAGWLQAGKAPYRVREKVYLRNNLSISLQAVKPIIKTTTSGKATTPRMKQRIS